MFLCVHHPDFHRLSRDEQARSRQLLLDFAESQGPDFEITRPDTWIIALARPSLVGQPPMPSLRLGKSTHPDLAHLVAVSDWATCAGTNHGQPPLLTHEDLDPLPAQVIADAGFAGHAAILATLQLWGLTTLGDFRRLPRQETAERMGPAAMHLHDTLNHKTQRPLRLFRVPEAFAQNIHFEHPIESLEALLFQANRILQELCSRLRCQYLAAASVRFQLDFETIEPYTRTLVLPEPSVSPAVILRPLHAVFETLRLAEPVVRLDLELEATQPGAGQREYLGRQIDQPERWADTLSRLEALLGPGRVGIAQVESSHRPDAFQVHPLSASPAAPAETASLPATPLPLRRFRPPMPVAVATSGEGLHPRPLALLSGPHPGPITKRRGPYPMSGDWWNPQSVWQRLEWDIEMENHHLLRLAFLPPDQWQLEGRY
jgi:protein ImuB